MKYLNTILLIVVLGATIGLFYLLGGTTNTPLFYFNLGFTCLLEIILFGSIIKISSKKLFNVPNLATTVQINRYVLFAAIIMIAFNIIHSILNLEAFVVWYFAALIILTVIYGVIIIFTLQGGNYQKKIDADIRNKNVQRTDFRTECLEIASEYKRISKEKTAIDYKLLEKGRIEINTISDKISMIPVAKLDRNFAKVEEISEEIQKLQELLNKFEVTVDNSANKEQIEKICWDAKKITTKINLINKL
jgi:hypothetical protein